MTGGMDTITRVSNNEASMFNLTNVIDRVTVTPLPPMLHHRAIHAMAASDPFVFVFGGTDRDFNPTDTCEYFDNRLNA